MMIVVEQSWKNVSTERFKISDISCHYLPVLAALSLLILSNFSKFLEVDISTPNLFVKN